MDPGYYDPILLVLNLKTQLRSKKMIQLCLIGFLGQRRRKEWDEEVGVVLR